MSIKRVTQTLFKGAFQKKIELERLVCLCQFRFQPLTRENEDSYKVISISRKRFRVVDVYKLISLFLLTIIYKY